MLHKGETCIPLLLIDAWAGMAPWRSFQRNTCILGRALECHTFFQLTSWIAEDDPTLTGRYWSGKIWQRNNQNSVSAFKVIMPNKVIRVRVWTNRNGINGFTLFSLSSLEKRQTKRTWFHSCQPERLGLLPWKLLYQTGEGSEFWTLRFEGSKNLPTQKVNFLLPILLRVPFYRRSLPTKILFHNQQGREVIFCCPKVPVGKVNAFEDCRPEVV